MSANEFPDGSETSSGAAAIVFERSQMIKGGPARYVWFDESAHNPPGLAVHRPAPGRPRRHDHAARRASRTCSRRSTTRRRSRSTRTAEPAASTMRLWKFHVDWTNPANSTFGNNGAAELHAPGGGVRAAAVRLRLRPELRAAEGRPAGPRHARRPADVPARVPAVLGLRLAAAQPHRRRPTTATGSAGTRCGCRRPARPRSTSRARTRRPTRPRTRSGAGWARSPRTRRATSRSGSALPARTTTRRSATPAASRATRSGLLTQGENVRVHRHRPADGGRGPLGRLQRPDGRPGRRLHVLLHPGVPGRRHRGARHLADEGRLVPLPGLQVGTCTRGGRGRPSAVSASSYQIGHGAASYVLGAGPATTSPSEWQSVRRLQAHAAASRTSSSGAAAVAWSPVRSMPCSPRSWRRSSAPPADFLRYRSACAPFIARNDTSGCSLPEVLVPLGQSSTRRRIRGPSACDCADTPSPGPNAVYQDRSRRGREDRARRTGKKGARGRVGPAWAEADRDVHRDDLGLCELGQVALEWAKGSGPPQTALRPTRWRPSRLSYRRHLRPASTGVYSRPGRVAFPRVSRYELIVIGGGVAGASCLFHLAERGVTRTLLLERSHLAAGSSGRSAAFVETLYTDRDRVRWTQATARLLERLAPGARRALRPAREAPARALGGRAAPATRARSSCARTTARAWSSRRRSPGSRRRFASTTSPARSSGRATGGSTRRACATSSSGSRATAVRRCVMRR